MYLEHPLPTRRSLDPEHSSDSDKVPGLLKVPPNSDALNMLFQPSRFIFLKVLLLLFVGQGMIS